MNVHNILYNLLFLAIIDDWPLQHNNNIVSHIISHNILQFKAIFEILYYPIWSIDNGYYSTYHHKLVRSHSSLHPLDMFL